MAAPEYILGIDYGAQRVGLAVAHEVARLPRPLQTLPNDASLTQQLKTIIRQESIARVVVGVPRNMDGSSSEQSSNCEAFANQLSGFLDVPVETVDETLSSVEAESALKSIGKQYTKADIDAMAASLILERYITEGASA